MKSKYLLLLLIITVVLTSSAYGITITYRNNNVTGTGIWVAKCPDGKLHTALIPSSTNGSTSMDYTCGVNSVGLDAGSETIQVQRETGGYYYVILLGKINGARFVQGSHMMMSTNIANLNESAVVNEFNRCLQAIKAGLSRNMQVDTTFLYTAPSKLVVRCDEYGLSYWY